MTVYTFDERTVSDLHKDARGFRPRGLFWSEWEAASNDQKQAIWDGLIDELDWELQRERARIAAGEAAVLQSLADIQAVMPGASMEGVRNVFVESLDLSLFDTMYGTSYLAHLLEVSDEFARQFDGALKDLAAKLKMEDA